MLTQKKHLVTIIVDVNHSTEMSLSLPENKFALLLQSFSQDKYCFDWLWRVHI
jgi:hypothetical protein